jgi:hypothetical protein
MPVMHPTRFPLALLACLFCEACGPSPQPPDGGAVHVSVVTDQADAVLRILDARAAGGTVSEQAWQTLLSADGYRRMMERETAIDRQLGIDRGYTDASFREWIEGDGALDDLEGRAAVLGAWHEVDGAAAGRRALAYLPDSAVLRATIYPIIRKQNNSFVWDLSGDPAIFMYVEPKATLEEIETILAHELHHVGLAGSCPRDEERGSEAERLVDRWLTGFGEGLAVLAAAGSPEGPTHAPDHEEGRVAWEAGMNRLASDMQRLEAFFLDIAAGRVEGEEMQRRGMAFINAPDAPQGAFYTVGWHMVATLERSLGRPSLIDVVCDPPALILEYNRAAELLGEGEEAPMWSEAFIRLVEGAT